MTEPRTAELTANLARVRARIAAAAQAAGRDPAEVTLVAVSKTFPAADVRILADLGVTDFGENRDDEAAAKAAELAELGLRWHFVGQVQRRKARSVASYADVVHAVDRQPLAAALDRGAHARSAPLDVLVQVSLDPPEQAGNRGGVDPAQAVELAQQIAELPRLRLAGVMGLAPRHGDPGPGFDRLVLVAADVQTVAPAAVIVSAGMSADLVAAVSRGATLVRVGTALFGGRPIRSEDGPPGG